jgi:hypothetical protein
MDHVFYGRTRTISGSKRLAAAEGLISAQGEPSSPSHPALNSKTMTYGQGKGVLVRLGETVIRDNEELLR